MSGGMVALKNRPCRFLGSVSRMALSSRAKPIESISSASSSTSTRMPAGIERLLAQVIEHAPGRADDDLRAGLERLDLLAHRGAAVDGDDLRAAELPDLLDLARDLQGQLAGGAEDEGLHAP